MNQGWVAGRLLLILPLLLGGGCSGVGARRGSAGGLEAAARAARGKQLSEQAQAAIDRGDLEQARVDLITLANVTPTSAEALYRLGTVLKLEGRWLEAETSFRGALKRDPDYALAMVGLGEVEALRGDSQSALKHFETAIEIDPFQPSAHYAMGRLLERMNRPNSALSEYFRALESDANNPDISLRIAMIQLARDEPDQALSRLDRVVEQAPANALARDVRGLANLRLGLASRAVVDFQAFLERKPDQPEGLYHLAVALERDGKPAEARRVAARALRLAPTLPGVRGLAERLALAPSAAKPQPQPAKPQ